MEFAMSAKTAARLAQPTTLANPTSTTTSRAARATNALSARVDVGYWSCANRSSIALATSSSSAGSVTSTLNCVTIPPVPPRCADSCRNGRCE
jgi:hypothetical protein